ncbi:hypothetical protein D3C87_1708410 [compost metagenome]
MAAANHSLTVGVSSSAKRLATMAGMNAPDFRFDSGRGPWSRCSTNRRSRSWAGLPSAAGTVNFMR